jgi:type IV secretory pathway VirB10-like protein
VFQPTPAIQDPVDRREEASPTAPSEQEETETGLEPEKDGWHGWSANREEQYLREQQRQRMAKLQARSAALDSPLTVDVRNAHANDAASDAPVNIAGQEASPRSASDLYSAALRSGLGVQNIDPNGQMKKADFFNQDIKDLGYLPNSVVPQLSPFELKRGSVIPATLITGINSDLPGRITLR